VSSSCRVADINLAFAALGGHDALAHLTVEIAEVLLNLAEVGEQRSGGAFGLQEALAELRRVHERELAGADALDLGVDLCAAPLELGNAPLGVELAALRHLAQQVEHELEPRFRAHELPLLEAREPLNRALRRGCEVEVRLVRARRVIAAQPAARVVGPVHQVIPSRSGRGLLTEPLTQGIEVIVEQGDQLRLREHADVRRQKRGVQEADDEGRVVRSQQAPGRVVASQGR
jgi:hypothetical protein